MPTHREKHIRIGKYLKDIVFAANDGIITTFAVVAGVAGADLAPAIILIIGFANLIADGFSMAAGNYLGTKSEKEFYQKEAAIEAQEIEETPEKEKEEIRKILAERGYADEDLTKMEALISSNKNFWVDFMMHEEIGLFAPKTESPLKNGLATFIAFILAGAVPIIPYLVIGGGGSFSISIIFSATALFTIGALRKFFSQRSWILSGLEMLFVGGFAATIAYLIGFLLKEVFVI